MKIYHSKGIIFRTLKYSETSIICDIYTREKGLRSFIVSGVRNTKSGAKAAIYQHLNIVDVVASDTDADKLTRLQEISLSVHFNKVNMDVVVSSMAIFMLEVSRNTIKEREANLPMYDFLENWFIYLDTIPKMQPLLHLLFMIELSSYLGFEPMENNGSKTPYFDMLEGVFCDYRGNGEYILDIEDSEVIHQLCTAERNNIQQLTLSKTQRDKATDHLLIYYKLHVPGFKDLNSLSVLRSVL